MSGRGANESDSDAGRRHRHLRLELAVQSDRVELAEHSQLERQAQTRMCFVA